MRYICCWLKRKKNFTPALKRSIRKTLGLKVSSSDARLEEDPYLRLGYGITSYFQMILQLLFLMLILTVFILPLLLHYSSFEALDGQWGYFASRFSLGNLGGS